MKKSWGERVMSLCASAVCGFVCYGFLGSLFQEAGGNASGDPTLSILLLPFALFILVAGLFAGGFAVMMFVNAIQWWDDPIPKLEDDPEYREYLRLKEKFEAKEDSSGNNLCEDHTLRAE